MFLIIGAAIYIFSLERDTLDMNPKSGSVGSAAGTVTVATQQPWSGRSPEASQWAPPWWPRDGGISRPVYRHKTEAGSEESRRCLGPKGSFANHPARSVLSLRSQVWPDSPCLGGCRDSGDTSWDVPCSHGSSRSLSMVLFDEDSWAQTPVPRVTPLGRAMTC